ncbi:MAG: hypothetical protein IT497_05765 [Ottowia sp.]|nr:hypothetical protein [Ottowia sp.]
MPVLKKDMLRQPQYVLTVLAAHANQMAGNDLAGHIHVVGIARKEQSVHNKLSRTKPGREEANLYQSLVMDDADIAYWNERLGSLNARMKLLKDGKLTPHAAKKTNTVAEKQRVVQHQKLIAAQHAPASVNTNKEAISVTTVEALKNKLSELNQARVTLQKEMSALQGKLAKFERSRL